MKTKVLIVDDSFFMRTLLKNILHSADYEVVGEAENGSSVLHMIKDVNPDVITLDMILPDTTGLEVLKKVKKEYPAAKIVMVSAVGQEAIVEECIAEGALAYIVKPFKEEKVLEVLSQSIEV